MSDSYPCQRASSMALALALERDGPTTFDDCAIFSVLIPTRLSAINFRGPGGLASANSNPLASHKPDTGLRARFLPIATPSNNHIRVRGANPA